MRGNLILMKIPTSISRKIRLRTKMQIQGKQEEIRSLTPLDLKKTITDYLRNRITPVTPVYLSDSPTKVKSLTPKSITLYSDDLSPIKNAIIAKNTSVLRMNEKIKRNNSTPKRKNKFTKEKKEDNRITKLNDSIGYIPENHQLKVIGSPSSSLVRSNKHNFSSLKTLNDLNYLFQRQGKNIKTRSKTSKKQIKSPVKLPKLQNGIKKPEIF